MAPSPQPPAPWRDRTDESDVTMGSFSRPTDTAAAAQRLVRRRYAAVHGAVPDATYPQFRTVPLMSMQPSAAVGLRLASAGALFLEIYLDTPVERAVSAGLGIEVARDRIVELGAHAAEPGRAVALLWAQTARHLDGLADVGVAVLTAPLRSMFARIGLPIVEICDADPARLPDGGRSWGKYYQQQPRVCAGLVADALPRLAKYDAGPIGACA